MSSATTMDPMLVEDECTTTRDATTTKDGMITTTTPQLEQEMTPEMVRDLMMSEESEFGYYLDMKRGYLDADSKMFALDIMNGILEIVYMDVQTGQSNPPTPQPTTPPPPPPILPTPSRLHCDTSNSVEFLHSIGANLRYVDTPVSTGTALRNVVPIQFGTVLNKHASPSGSSPTPNTPTHPPPKLHPTPHHTYRGLQSQRT